MKRGILFALAAAHATPAIASCIPIPSFWSPALFARYPAMSAKGPWRAPDLRRGDAHLYRTILHRYGQGEPDFAARIKVVLIGCGAGSVCPSFVDRLSGRVWFVPTLRVLSYMPVDLGASTRLTCHRDSRLMVLVGTRNEDERTAGVSLYEWREQGPRLIRFVPERQLCGEGVLK